MTSRTKADGTVVHRQQHFRWEEVAERRDTGVSIADVYLEMNRSPGSGAVRVVHVEFPPGYTVPAHSHASDYMEITLAGSQQVTRKWYHAGDVRTARAGTFYGPLVAGPEACEVLLIFAGDSTLIEPPRRRSS